MSLIMVTLFLLCFIESVTKRGDRNESLLSHGSIKLFLRSSSPKLLSIPYFSTKTTHHQATRQPHPNPKLAIKKPKMSGRRLRSRTPPPLRKRLSQHDFALTKNYEYHPSQHAPKAINKVIYNEIGATAFVTCCKCETVYGIEPRSYIPACPYVGSSGHECNHPHCTKCKFQKVKREPSDPETYWCFRV